jgi:hypothetical protein
MTVESHEGAFLPIVWYWSLLLLSFTLLYINTNSYILNETALHEFIKRLFTCPNFAYPTNGNLCC